MADNFGNGVSRTLSALQHQFQTLVWQADMPPLDSEMTQIGQIASDQVAKVLEANVHSGFFVDPTTASGEFQTNPAWSNFFKLGSAPLWANVNGWMIPVTGTATAEGDLSNRVDLYPPPSTDSRIDFVFLEVWQALVAPNPSTVSKPSASLLWKYGNTKYGGTNLVDDLADPFIGAETTLRVQLQYRLRVFGHGSGLGSSVNLAAYPDGLDDPNVLAQGTASAPVAGFSFTNMGTVNGDSGLWRAGTGATSSLGTVDGYVYAIPVGAIFRRNSSPFVSITPGGNANQNGAVNRNPTSLSYTDPAEGTEVLGTATLTSSIDEAATGNIQVDGLVGSGLDNATLNWDSVFLQIDGEIFSISSVNTGVSPATMAVRASGGRGRYGTMAVPHDAGATVSFFTWRHDGLFADQIVDTDIHNLMRSVNLGDWDAQRLLMHNLTKLFQGGLRTSYKQSGTGDTQGTMVVEVDMLDASGATGYNQVDFLDGPDGIRTTFSDGVTFQSDVTMLLDDPAVSSGGAPGFVNRYDAGTVWGVGAGFLPGGFLSNGTGWNNGDTIFLNLGGSDGNGGARGTFRAPGTKAVRFVGPAEYWAGVTAQGKQTPFELRFLSEGATSPAAGTEASAAHPGPMYPLAASNFETPFIVLGGVLNADLINTNATVYPESGPSLADWEVDFPGVNFDTLGDWYSLSGGEFATDPTAVAKPLLHGSRTLYGMLTNNGQDSTGTSTEVYLVLWGDTVNTTNNGVVRVVGAGTVGYTSKSATTSSRLRVEFVAPTVTDFVSATGISVEVRSQYLHSEDGSGSVNNGAVGASACVVITDLEGSVGGTSNPWNGLLTSPVASKAVLNTSLMYHPGRGGLSRVASQVFRVAANPNAASGYLRQARGALDTVFPAQAGVPSGDLDFPLEHIQTWNRLSSLGLHAPDAPLYGGQTVSFTEQDRDAEVFVDAGSKTLMIRPYQHKLMTLTRYSLTSGQAIPTTYVAGHNVDGAAIFAAGLATVFEVPPEHMPRFGRQDIPFFKDVAGLGTGTFLQGVNHLFVDTLNENDPQFNVVGGTDNVGAGGVHSMLFQTTSTLSSGLDYGEWGAIPVIGTNAYQSRLYLDPNVVSSDLGRGLKGIQLPPYMGVARVYGVYDRRDWEAAGGQTFGSNRITPVTNPPANLLRTDADKQTLFIVQGDAAMQALTGRADSHTYVIPEDALDIRLSREYIPGEVFEDLEYIVEAVVFGFADGFINKNNYILARANKGAFGGGSDAELEGAAMVLPTAAPINDKVYVAYNRIPYQGDPYMTRDGATRTTSDYEARYGQISSTNAVGLQDAIQQFDSAGNTIPTTANARPLQVLASLDFWTTLGTGKVGGPVFAGTALDVGHVVNDLSAASRVPLSSTDPLWQVCPRTFGQGQWGNASHARLTLGVIDNTAFTGSSAITVVSPTGVSTTLTAGVDFAVGLDASLTAVSIGNAINAKVELTAVLKAMPSLGGASVPLVANPVGAEGNLIRVSHNAPTALQILSDAAHVPTSSYMTGGVDLPSNSGTGVGPIEVAGLSERLPLGILLQDSDFLGEDLLRDGSGQIQSFAGGVQVTSFATPLLNGKEYTRLTGGAGHWLVQADGSVLRYGAYDSSLRPTGTRGFRVYRGGSAYVLSGPTPGGPVDWAAGSLPANFNPVLKGGVLAGKALLVRNYPETAFTGNSTTSHGDEIQMVIFTQGILGKGVERDVGQTLVGMISPTGYGEGYAAVDRYRLEGLPLAHNTGSTPPDMGGTTLAVFPFPDLSTNVR